MFTIWAKVKDAGDLQYVESTIGDEIARVAKEGVDDETLSEVLARMRYEFAAGLDTAHHVASTAAWYGSLTGDLMGMNAYYALVDRVTAADVKRVAAKYFTAENRTVVTLVSEVK